MTYTFTGPGTYVFPEHAGPPDSEAGTLTAEPGKTYNFDGDPPGPANWWSITAPPKASAKAPAPAPAPAPVAAKATTAATTATETTVTTTGEGA